jgi:hypothetical protein
LAQGPEEKRGLAGRDAGYSIAINAILSDMRPSLGKGVPPPDLCHPRKNSNKQMHLVCRAM